MKRILVVSACEMRGQTTGLTGRFLSEFDELDPNEFCISIFDVGSFEKDHKASNYSGYGYFALPNNLFARIVCRTPRVRVYCSEIVIIHEFEKILKKEHYDWIILYQVFPYADKLTEVTHRNGAKIIFVPWGSEILRASENVKKRLRVAFSQVDYVLGAEKANTICAAMDIYHVPETKIKDLRNDLFGVKRLDQAKGQRNDAQLAEIVGLPSSCYYIVCGYNGYAGQKHKVIIDSIAENKDVLPHNYLLVFPITYGAQKGYIEELESYVESCGLRAFFIKDYMSDEQMTSLHLITDLFIEIQPTDNGNAFLIEALYAENQIVTGTWLSYNQFEQFGIPYHLVNSIEELPSKLREIFLNDTPKAVIPSRLREMFRNLAFEDRNKFWINLFNE